MYNFIDGDFFESLADYSFGDMYSNNITQPSYEILKSVFDKFENPIFFIETHRIGYLLNEVRRFPNQKCRIIAHNSDATFGQELLQYIPKNVEKLWCQNYNYIETDVVKSLPIGLERVRWFPEQKKQESLYNIMSSDIKRDKLVYMNFNPNTNPERKKIFELLKDKVDYEMVGNGGDYQNYLRKLKEYKYIISPPGNGIDCHRNWEAIYCGCIPIVLESYFTMNIYHKTTSVITPDYTKIVDDVNNNSYEIQYKNYWEKLIKYEKN
jgi:hypothetical protein